MTRANKFGSRKPYTAEQWKKDLLLRFPEAASPEVLERRAGIGAMRSKLESLADFLDRGDGPHYIRPMQMDPREHSLVNRVIGEKQRPTS